MYTEQRPPPPQKKKNRTNHVIVFCMARDCYNYFNVRVSYPWV